MSIFIVSTFYFLSIIVFFTFLGNLILRLLKLRFKSYLENFLFSLNFSLILLSLLTYAALTVRLQILVPPLFWAFTVLGLSNFIYLIRKKIKLREFRFDWGLTFFVVGMSIIMISITARSGWQTKDGIEFFGSNIHDGFLHLSLIGELKNHFPPQHPDFSGIYLKEYHYLLDLTLAKFSQIYGFRETDLYFRFFPGFAAILWSSATYLFAQEYLRSKAASYITIFFSVLGGGFAYILPIFNSSVTNLDGTFGVSSPITTLINLHFSLSIPILILSFLAFDKFLKEEKFGWGLIIVFFTGALFGLKIYAGIIALLSIGLATLCYLAKTKRIKILWIFFSSVILSVMMYLPLRTGKTGVVFAPGEVVQSVVRGPLSWTLWELQRQVYAEHSNSLGLLRLGSLGLITFIFGNLGTKVLGLGEIVKFSKSVFLRKNFGIFPSALLSSFLFPLFFIQTITPFNIIQFWWYFIYFMSFLAAVFTWEIVKKRSIIQKFVLLAVIVFLTIPSAVFAITPYLQSKNSYSVSNSKLAALSFLKKNSSPSDTILEIPLGVDTGNLNFDYPSIPAFSHRRVFLGQELIEFSYLDTQRRLKELEKIIVPLDCKDKNLDKFCADKIDLSQNAILENKINYIFSSQALFWLEGNSKISSLIYNRDGIFIYQIK